MYDFSIIDFCYFARTEPRNHVRRTMYRSMRSIKFAYSYGFLMIHAAGLRRRVIAFRSRSRLGHFSFVRDGFDCFFADITSKRNNNNNNYNAYHERLINNYSNRSVSKQSRRAPSVLGSSIIGCRKHWLSRSRIRCV